MKRIRSILCHLLVISLLLVSPVCASGDVTPYSSCFFRSTCTSLEQSADSAFKAWFEVSASCGMKDELGVTEILVQKSSDGVNWENVKTYTAERYTHLIAYNASSHAGYIVHAGTQGYYYRTYVTYYAKNSTGEGYMFEYSEVLYLQPLNN